MNATRNFSCGLIVLAAGASRRMGRPKLLLPVGGQPLLRHVLRAALTPAVAPVVVVLGADAPEIQASLAGLPVRTVVNEGWSEGMGSSVRTGLQAVLADGATRDGVILSLGDQPALRAAHLANLLEIHRKTGQPIVASQCDGELMPPIFFAAKFFPELAALQGDAGARFLLRAHAAEVAVIQNEELGDLDTPEQYEEFVKRSRPKNE